MKQINKKTFLISIILILIIASTVIISLNLKSDKKGNIEIASTNSKSQVTSLSDQIIDKSKASTNSSVNDNKYKFTYDFFVQLADRTFIISLGVFCSTV